MAKPKLDLNWKTPDVPPKLERVQLSPVLHHSGMLLIVADGKIIPGVYMKYMRDINDNHFQAKEGDSLFVDTHGNPLTDVHGYYELKSINIPNLAPEQKEQQTKEPEHFIPAPGEDQDEDQDADQDED